MTTARTIDKGHGRIEIRTAQSSDLLNNWLQARGFAEAEQVIRIERRRRIKGEESIAVDYYLSNLARDEATAFDFLKWIRAHWGIENKLHHVKDVTFEEDQCRARKGGSAQILSALRNVAIHLLHNVKAPSTRAATQRLQIHPEEAIELITTPLM